jgi:hyperosmotically inducible protein
MCAKRWALLSLCLLLAAPASQVAGETKAAARGEGRATETSADQALVARIQDALGKDPLLRDATNLSVAAREGEVTLSGSVGNTAQAERAVQVARGVEGVQRVEDKLVRESKADVPATPHQSEVIDAPVDKNAETEKPRAK